MREDGPQAKASPQVYSDLKISDIPGRLSMRVSKAASMYGQVTVLTLTTPAATNDTMGCVTGLLGGRFFADFSDLDGDVYLSVGPSPGDAGFCWYDFGSADSLLLDYSADYKIHDGVTFRRVAFEIDFSWEMTCFRIWNSGASADSSLVISRYKYVP